MQTNRRILVVDDQKDLSEQLSRFLAKTGKPTKTFSLLERTKARLTGQAIPEIDDTPTYDVDIANQGQQAVTMVQRASESAEPYAVIFLDMRMPPGWDGLETMEKIWKIDDRVQIVLCTAYSDYSWAEIIDRVGERDNLLILKKPFDSAEVSQLAMGLTKKYALDQEEVSKFAHLQQKERELEQARNLLQNVLASLPSMVATVTLSGEITQWNAAAEYITGIPENAALGLCIWDIVPFLKKQREEFDTMVTEGAARELQGVMVKPTEYSDPRFFDVCFSPFRSSHDEVIGAVVRVDDITDQAMQDQRILQSQKMESVGNLAAGLAHNFNNVIGGIQGTLGSIELSMAMADSLETLKRELQEDLEVISQASTQGSAMIEQLLALSKNRDLELADYDLNDVLNRVMAVCKNTFTSSVQIEVVPYEGTALVRAYASQLEQVLLNLCVNARHAMTIMRPEGEPEEGVLRVTLEKIRVGEQMVSQIPEGRVGDYYMLSVSDNGVGMEEHVTKKIFEPYFTTKDKDHGTGLGLPMVYNIVSQHKGFIDIYSEVGKGTTFYVFLPVLPVDKQDT